MVLEDPLWQDGNDYPARLDRQFIEDVFNIEGVIDPSTGAMRVAPRAAGANMSVDIAAGRAVIKGDDEANQGSYRVISTAVENVPIGAAPGSDRRIDLIVARVRDAAVTGGVSSDWLLEVIPGTVAASPVAPAVPSTAIPLAEVTVTSTTTSITAAEITKDRRTAAQNAAYATKAALAELRSVQTFLSTFESTTSAGFVPLATADPVHDFTAPASGIVEIIVSANGYTNTAGHVGLMGARVTRVSDGVEVLGLAGSRAAAFQHNSNAFGSTRSSPPHRLSGLTPGVIYRVTPQYLTTGGTATFGDRYVTTQPIA
jgi:hypothetical protein